MSDNTFIIQLSDGEVAIMYAGERIATQGCCHENIRLVFKIIQSSSF